MKADKTLRIIAEEIFHKLNGNISGAIVEDAIAVCEYTSRNLGRELTIAEGSRVREWLDMDWSNRQ